MADSIPKHPPPDRRTVLRTIAAGSALPAISFMDDLGFAKESAVENPLQAKSSHSSPRAKRMILIFLNGGLSHVESFDHKPKLEKDAWKTVKFHEWQGKPGDYTFYLKPPQWKFRPGGQSGMMVSDLFPYMRTIVDELCILNSMCSDHTNHYEASLGMHTGSFTFARPSLGSWISYGLGTENPLLPSFVVLSPTLPYAGTQAWASDFLPGSHQGTHITPGATPIANLEPRSRDRDLQRLEIDFIRQLNSRRQRQQYHPLEAAALAARTESFETAFGMEQAAPEVFDLGQESKAIHELYGLESGKTDGFAWQCLVARRMAERGVRFVEVISSNWDHHGNMEEHAPLSQAIDQPIAALITDLKQRGMLDDTLVVLTSEFGRTPHHMEKNHKGREHHHQVFSTVLAGGGVKSGFVYGKSDEYGIEPAENRLHLHDFHATLLHVMGLDHERLTYRHAGRDYRLTDVHGNVVDEILA